MASASASITTFWVPPDPLTGLSGTAVEDDSYIQLNWDISTLDDVDFDYYKIYRRVLGETDWELLDTVYSKVSTEYLDAKAGNGNDYEYQVYQFKNGLASSLGDTITAGLSSDVWWVVGNENPTDRANSFELPVSEETHTRPIQQEVFEPIVNTRKKVARGNVLGFEGTLKLRWLSSERAVAKQRLNFLATNSGPHTLKSPFGDVWRVEFDAPDYKYSGGGHLDVDIGWVEVA